MSTELRGLVVALVVAMLLAGIAAAVEPMILHCGLNMPHLMNMAGDGLCAAAPPTARR